MRDMKQKAEELGLKSWSADLVEDLVNVNAGGTYVSNAEIAEKCRERADELGHRVRNAGDEAFFSGPAGAKLRVADFDGDASKAAGAASSRWIEHLTTYHKNAQEFVNNADFDGCEGRSPLERAMNYVRLMREKDQPDETPHHDDEATTNPLFFTDDMKQLAEEINERVQLIRDIPVEDIQDLIGGGAAGDDLESDPGMGIKSQIASDFTVEQWIWMKMSKRIDSLPGLTVSLTRQVEPDPDGREVQIRPIAGWDQMTKLTPREWTYPPMLRAYRVASRMAMVRVKVRTVEKRQLLYILVDGSGSMGGDSRYRAGGIVMNRLRAVKRGEAVVYVRFFDSTCWMEEYYAHDVPTAVKCMEDIRNVEYRGGGTAIDHCARQATERIGEILHGGEELVKPELLVVTDGQDTVKMTLNDLGGTTMHAFVLGANDTLVNIARQSGGVGISLRNQR